MRFGISVLQTMAFLASLAFVAPVYAQTPDGETPAVEHVCDALQGATPGLYGLCVAYCEAHDAHLLSNNDAADELDTPSRKILEAYNNLKAEADPAMPCVQPAGCPCWTEQLLETVLLPPTANFDENFENACALGNILSGGTRWFLENFENGTATPPPPTGSFYQLTSAEFSDGTGQCTFFSKDFVGAPPNSQLPLNTEETAACRDMLLAHADLNKIDGIVWDCFSE